MKGLVVVVLFCGIILHICQKLFRGDYGSGYTSKPDWDKMEEEARRRGSNWTRNDRPSGW